MSPISNSFIPNFEKDDIWLAFKLVFKPWLWQKGKAKKLLEERFKERFGFKYAFAFNSGRSAFLAILKAIDLKENQGVFVQCFTCNALLNPILSLKGKPVFVDIDKNLNLDPEELIKKFEKAKNPKVIIAQHTFGYPAQIEKIKSFAKEKGLILIEDCAHSLGAKYNNQLIGTFGEAAFFSFGRDKIISSVYGGIAVTNSEEIAKKIKEFQESLPSPPAFWTFKTLLLPIIFALLLPLYNFLNIGKSLLFILRKIGAIIPSVYPSENYGKLANIFPAQMPNALAILALNQLEKIERFNSHRKKIAKFYNQELRNQKNIKIVFSEWPDNLEPVFMRFPILVENKKGVLKKLKEANILLEDGWSDSVIVPKKSQLGRFDYQKGECPKAEKICQQIINLPTNINTSKKSAEKIIEILRENL